MTSEQSQAPRVALLTLGCPKNEVDSRTMRGLLEARGYTVTEGVEEAHFILLNTCAFIEAAVEESLDTIFELAALPHVQSGECKLVVAGCLPSRFGADLTAELPEVAAFVPVAEESSIVEVLDGLVQAGQGLVWNGGRGWNRGTGVVFQFDQGQIG
ncbi:MAG: hypothetical protein FWE41_06735, partial [Coriobacteriia bacterium]|nr:hypothetical protein [Coriobacteriia bacterium]